MNAFRCLAIETSSAQGSVAACDGDRVEVFELAQGSSSSREVFHAVSDLLARLDLSPAELDCIACGNGPGSFTGVRVAVSATQGLAFAASIPVCPISTLEGLAARAGAEGPVAACLDARMGEAYVGIYEFSAAAIGAVVMCDSLVDPDGFRLSQMRPDAVPVGTGWEIWSCMLEGHEVAGQDSLTPHAASLLKIAAGRYAEGTLVNAFDALPNYIRDNVTQ